MREIEFYLGKGSAQLTSRRVRIWDVDAVPHDLLTDQTLAGSAETLNIELPRFTRCEIELVDTRGGVTLAPQVGGFNTSQDIPSGGLHLSGSLWVLSVEDESSSSTSTTSESSSSTSTQTVSTSCSSASSGSSQSSSTSTLSSRTQSSSSQSKSTSSVTSSSSSSSTSSQSTSSQSSESCSSSTFGG